MNKKIISIMLIVTISLNLFACENINQDKKTITADTTYYSVTIGSRERDSLVYMNLDIEIPKITYSNNDGVELIDSVNAEISNKLTSLINDAKEKALATYETYIESAKNNAKTEIENKIKIIKNKYKNIIGDEEVELLSELTNDDVVRNPYDFFNRRGKFATKSNVERPPRKDRQKKEKEEIVNGFTGTSDVIIPGLHNKNIIVVETTEAETKITSETINIEGRPGRSNRDFGEFSDFNNSERPKRASRSNAIPPKNNSYEDKKEAIEIVESENTTLNSKIENGKQIEATKSFIPKDENSKLIDDDKNNLIESEIIDADIEKEITLDDFYNELDEIYKIRIPDDYTLALEYIPTTITCNFEVKCLDEDYLSLFVELVESRTTETVQRLFYNIDLNDKKIVTIKDILGDKFKETCVSSINAAIDKWTDDQKSTLIENYSVEDYITENAPFFINNNHKPVIQIEKFVITIGSTGYHEFQIT